MDRSCGEDQRPGCDGNRAFGLYFYSSWFAEMSGQVSFTNLVIEMNWLQARPENFGLTGLTGPNTRASDRVRGRLRLRRDRVLRCALRTGEITRSEGESFDNRRRAYGDGRVGVDRRRL